MTGALLVGLLAALWLSFALQPAPPTAPALTGGLVLHAQHPATHWPAWRAALPPSARAELASAWTQATGLPLNRLTLWLVAGEALTLRPAIGDHPWGLVARPGRVWGWLARGMLPGCRVTAHGLALSPDPAFADEVAGAALVDAVPWAPLRLAVAEPDESAVTAPRLTLERHGDGRVALHVRVPVDSADPWRAGPLQTGLWQSSVAALHAAEGPALAALADALAALVSAWMPVPDGARWLPGVRLPPWPALGMDAWRDAGVALSGVDTTDTLPWPVVAASGAVQDPDAPPWAPWLEGLPQLPHRWGAVPGVIAPILGEHVALCVAQGPGRWCAASQEPALSALVSASAMPAAARTGVAWLRVDPARLAGSAMAATPWLSEIAAAPVATWSGLLQDFGAVELLAGESPRDGMLGFWAEATPEAGP